MTALTSFYTKVMMEARGCEPVVALQYIRDAAIDFFQRSRSWRARTAPITLKHSRITGITQAGTAVVTVTAHPFAAGDQVLITNVGGMEDINNLVYTIANPTANTVELTGISSTSLDAYTSLGDMSQAIIRLTTPVAGAVIADVLDGQLNTGQRLQATARPTLESDYFGQWESKLGMPQKFCMHDEQSIRLVPAPFEMMRNALVLHVALKPAQDATTIPDDLYERYSGDIEVGAIAMLLEVADKPWTNQPKSSSLMDDFEARIRRARNRAIRGFNRAPISVDSVSFETPGW